jgi:copper chaperone
MRCDMQHAPATRATGSDYFAGVESYNVSLETQTAEITAADSLSYDTVLEKIKKTGKAVKSGEADGEPKDI